MIRVRLAPSPTGKLHLGTARTALFNYLFAKKEGGRFLLRFEDTDRSRSTKDYEQDIIDNLKWLGLKWDKGPFYQMDRLKIYRKFAQKLVLNGFGKEVNGAVLFWAKNSLKTLKIDAEETTKIFKDKKSIEYKDSKAYLVKNIGTDLIHGSISGLVSDTVLLRSDGLPTFHLTVVVDDALMKITHIIRGDDHLPNTPLHILLQKALGFKTPFYVHLPLILSPDRKKMSKRHGAVAVSDYKKMGYLPEAMVNFLASLGLSGREKEILSLGELAKIFDFKKLQKSPAVFYKEKLDWINGQWIRKISVKELTKRANDFGFKKLNEKIIGLIQPRIKMLADIPFWTDFFFKEPKYKRKLLLGDLGADLAKQILLSWQEDKGLLFKQNRTKTKAKEVAELFNLSIAEALYPLRIAITGQKVSPPLFESMEILGKKECLKRIKKALGGLE